MIIFFLVFASICVAAVFVVARTKLVVFAVGFLLSYLLTLVFSGMVGHGVGRLFFGDRFVDLGLICVVVAAIASFLKSKE